MGIERFLRDLALDESMDRCHELREYEYLNDEDSSGDDKDFGCYDFTKVVG